jgi:CubicO group peptidase (beta-lactamase class C family)
LCIFSATKAITSAAAWLLVQERRLDEDERVADIVPEFATNGKDVVTVGQLFTHTAGFPHAPFRPLDWVDRSRRLARFAQWRLTWTPGSRFEYHPTSSMWVIAEIIERRSGRPFVDFVRERVIEPLGLPSFYVGLPADENARVVPCEYVGEALTAEDYLRLGLPQPPETEVTEDAILNFNRPEVRAVGVPGGGGITSAGDLALFYQALLHGGLAGGPLWSQAMLRSARRIRTGDLVDPLYGKRVNRGLGIIIAGDEDRHYRGFGHTNSPEAFGHNGAGGQIAWVDPASGLSFVYLTSGHDRNPVRTARRGVALSSLAAGLTAPR